jgi:pilus assembly protein Flp/PilA
VQRTLYAAVYTSFPFVRRRIRPSAFPEESFPGIAETKAVVHFSEKGRLGASPTAEEVEMRNLSLKIYVRMQALKDESGQDMVEYAIVMGLIALGATVAMKGLATTIGTAFTTVGTNLTTYTS